MIKNKQHKSYNAIDDCWNEIGVWGRQGQVCEKLKEIVHCHHCDVFVSAGRTLLDREASEIYQEEWRELLAEDRIREKKNNAVVVFRLGNEWFALPAGLFQEIIQACKVHRIPHNSNPMLKGIVSIRGELQLCISIGHILNLDKGDDIENDARKCVYERMMVIESGSGRYVFPVSEIRDIYHYADSELDSPPETAKGDESNLLKGIIKWKEQYIGCLDDGALITAIDGLL